MVSTIFRRLPPNLLASLGVGGATSGLGCLADKQIRCNPKQPLACTIPSMSNRKIGRARHVRERLSGVATQDETFDDAT
jgi:hypothetical protein